MCGVWHAYKNKQWATLIKTGGKDYYFDGVKDMAHFYFADEVAKEAYVSDYYTLEKLDAKEAFYVHGSNVLDRWARSLSRLKTKQRQIAL